jgi:hypothetical protein
MRTRIAIVAAAALAMTGALLTCTANGGSIYATIEKETKIPVSTLNQTITVQDIVQVGPPANPLPYFVAAGAIYNGSVPDGSNNVGWPVVGQAPVAIHAPLDNSLNPAISQAMVASPFGDNTLYASFFSSDGSVMGVYWSNTATNPYSFRPSDGAIQRSGPALGGPLMGKEVVLLAATPANAAPVLPPLLFAVAATVSASGTSFELDYSQDGITWTAVPAMVGLPSAITGVTLFNNAYYATAGGTLYTGANAAALAVAAQQPPVLGSELLRGATSDANFLIVPGKQGAVYVMNTSSAWTSYTTSDQVNSLVVGFLTVSQAIASNLYLVGSDGNGFYYLNVGAAGTFVNGLTRFSDVTVTGLYAGAIRRVLIDPAQANLVFLGAAGTGLWRSSFATGQAGTWIHE